MGDKIDRAAGRKQFLGFMMKDFSVCSMKFDLQGIQNEADFVNPSIKQRQVKALGMESLFGAN